MSDPNADDRLPQTPSGAEHRIEQLEEELREKFLIRDALEESEKRYRRLFESAKDGILILDAETGKVVDVNPFLLQLLEFEYDSIFGRHIWELGVFKDIAASQDAFKTLQCNDYIRYVDLPLETCGGKAIVITDAQEKIQFANPAFERMTGYSLEESVGQSRRLLKSGKQDETFYRKLWATISSGGGWAGRMVNKRKNGAHYTVVPASDRKGNLRLTRQNQTMYPWHEDYVQ